MRYFKEFFRFFNHILENRKLLFSLAYTDFREQYLGSYLGIVWSVLRPSLFILIIWFVFSVGFKARPSNGDTPFALWLLCGMIPWFFFAEAMNKSMNAIVGNAYLVKKVAFRVSILPLVKVISSLMIHLILVFLLLLVFLFNGYMPNIYWFQILYYIACTIILVTSISFLTSSLRVFIKDTAEVIGIVIQFGFWFTPIFWSIDMIPLDYQEIIKINPMFYIVEGFRDSFINNVWFWEKEFDSLKFLFTSSLFLFVGAIVFKRLRPHFGDVL